MIGLQDEEPGGTTMTTKSQAPSLGAIKERQQKTWTSGDFARIGNLMVLMGERLCEAVDLRAGSKVLDVATGSGNAAISAARRFCKVWGVDYVPHLIDYARKRAEVEQMEVNFEVGDAENLPYPDASFDVVLSTIGVMFAPNQEKAASELLRVCQPGGKIGLANWTPDGYIGNMFRTIGKHAPPPAGVKPPPLWGTEERLGELFGNEVSSLETTRRSFIFRYPSVAHCIEYHRTYFGPIRTAFEVLDLAGQEALARDLEGLLDRWNTSGDGTIVVPGDYLEIVAIKR
jgi:SAM-dependent methyltransferase